MPNPSTHAIHAASEASGALEVGALRDVLQRSEVEVSPTHCLAVAIRYRTLHLGAPGDELPIVVAGKSGVGVYLMDCGRLVGMGWRF